MLLFESALVLFAVAVLLLIVARKLGVPYPAVLALSGGCVAALPGAPSVQIEPHLALALFVAPAVMDSAFDMPPRLLLRYWLPLTSLAVLLVLVTTAVVAWAGHVFAGLPLAAAIALGAIVAPPNAAAAAAVLKQFRLPRRTMAVLQGESLLNDAVALLIFGAAVGAVSAGGGDSVWPAALLLAVPGGALFGVLCGALMLYLVGKTAGTLSANIVRFIAVYGAWVLADRLHLSSIAAVAAMAMVVAHFGPSRTSARDRVSAKATWAAVVFVLNVLAFLLVGLQARVILAGMEGTALWQALGFAATTLLLVTAVRIAWVMAYGAALRSYAHYAGSGPKQPAPSVKLGVLVSWCGMRGLVTLATALALPAGFPGRDLIVLCAFAVVLGTLVLQGFTMRPLIHWLGIEPDCSLYTETSQARKRMLDAALAALAGRSGAAAQAVRAEYAAARAVAENVLRPQAATAYDALRLEALAGQRRVLARWRRSECIDDDAFHRLEEELDRAELNATPPGEAGLVES